MSWSVGLLILTQIELQIFKPLFRENKCDCELAMLYGIVKSRIICKVRVQNPPLEVKN